MRSVTSQDGITGYQLGIWLGQDKTEDCSKPRRVGVTRSHSRQWGRRNWRDEPDARTENLAGEC